MPLRVPYPADNFRQLSQHRARSRSHMSSKPQLPSGLPRTLHFTGILALSTRSVYSAVKNAFVRRIHMPGAFHV